MRILIALTYYRPHYSGLTIYTERLARALAARNHQVTVLTSRFSQSLPAREMCDGVEVIRPWVLMRISKGVIMPMMEPMAWSLLRQADVVNLHVPQLDAAPISVLSQFSGKPVVLTYHCDLYLPKGVVHSIANQVSHLANHISARASDLIVTNTQDYADHSPFLKHYLQKVRVVPPPAVLPPVTESDIQAFRQKFGVRPTDRIIGMAARLATEKGVEYLIEAMPAILEKFPNARVLFVGTYQNVIGEEQYAAYLAPAIERLGEHWQFLGVLSPIEMATFFQLSEVTVLPSINQTESFGMVQIESMMRGTPVVATDLPGVRQPVISTGMGRIVPPRDGRAIAEAIITILEQPERYRGSTAEVIHRYAPETIAEEYEQLFRQVICRS